MYLFVISALGVVPALAGIFPQQQQQQQPSGAFNEECLIAKNFQLNFSPQGWWSCNRHVAECFDEVTTKLKTALTQGKCKSHACYSKESVQHLQSRIQVSPSANKRRANGCAIPEFNVGMERIANALIQKANECLLDLEQYESLLTHVMAGMHAERDCFLQSNPLLTQHLLQMHQQQQHHWMLHHYGSAQLPRYAYSPEKFMEKRCLLTPLVEMTLRMRLAQYGALIKPGTLPTWQARSAKNYLANDAVNKEWVDSLGREDLRDPQVVKHAESSKKILEEYLRALGCSSEPDPRWQP